MRQQHISGQPRLCLNRHCREPFTQQCHRGYITRNATEVYAVMQCRKCRDIFLVSQAMHLAHDYYNNKLPKDNQSGNSSPITLKELEDVREQLNNLDVLKSLNQTNSGEIVDEPEPN